MLCESGLNKMAMIQLSMKWVELNVDNLFQNANSPRVNSGTGQAQEKAVKRRDNLFTTTRHHPVTAPTTRFSTTVTSPLVCRPPLLLSILALSGCRSVSLARQWPPFSKRVCPCKQRALLNRCTVMHAPVTSRVKSHDQRVLLVTRSRA